MNTVGGKAPHLLKQQQLFVKIKYENDQVLQEILCSDIALVFKSTMRCNTVGLGYCLERGKESGTSFAIKQTVAQERQPVV